MGGWGIGGGGGEGRHAVVGEEGRWRSARVLDMHHACLLPGSNPDSRLEIFPPSSSPSV